MSWSIDCNCFAHYTRHGIAGPMEIPWKPQKSLPWNPWNPWEQCGTHGIPMGTVESYGAPWKNRGKPWKTMDLLVENRGKPWKPWKPLGDRGIHGIHGSNRDPWKSQGNCGWKTIWFTKANIRTGRKWQVSQYGILICLSISSTLQV